MYYVLHNIVTTKLFFFFIKTFDYFNEIIDDISHRYII